MHVFGFDVWSSMQCPPHFPYLVSSGGQLQSWAG